MIYFLIFFVILLIDTIVFKVLVGKMAGDMDVELPDYAESLMHCGIANVGGALLRMAGIRFPIHFAYFYHIFYNKYGLNQVAVFLCLAAMFAVEFGTIMLMLAMFTR